MPVASHLTRFAQVQTLKPRLDPRMPELPGAGLGGHAPDALRDPLSLLRRVAAHGDAVRMWLLYEPVHVFHHPDAVAHLLGTHGADFERGTTVSAALMAIGPNILALRGEDWARHRQKIRPSFHPHLVANAAEAFVTTATAAIDAWRSLAGPFDIALEALAIGERLIAQSLFGIDLAPDEARRVATSVRVAGAWVYEQNTAVLGLQPSEVKDAFAAIDAVIDRALATPAPPGAPPTYLERLRQDRSFPPDELRGALRILMFATENASQAFGFAAWLLARHPEWQDRLLTEIPGTGLPPIDQLDALPILDRVYKEALRLYPIMWMVEREALSDQEILGYFIPAGATVMTTQLALHRDPRYWDAPDRFDPDRFLPAQEARRPRFAYFPFDSGPRTCPATRWTSLQVKLLLALALQRFRLTTPADELDLRVRFILTAPTPVALEPRA